MVTHSRPPERSPRRALPGLLIVATALCPARDCLRRFAIHDVEGMVGALEADGFALAAAALTPALVEQGRAMIDALQPLRWDEVHADGGRCMDRYLCVFNRDPFWLEFLDRPGIIDVAEASARARLPRDRTDGRGDRSPVFAAIRCMSITCRSPRRPRRAAEAQRMPIFILTHTSICAMSASDLAPTCVLPGSHRARPRAACRRVANGDGREAVPVLAHAGECLLFRSDCGIRAARIGTRAPSATSCKFITEGARWRSTSLPISNGASIPR